MMASVRCIQSARANVLAVPASNSKDHRQATRAVMGLSGLVNVHCVSLLFQDRRAVRRVLGSVPRCGRLRYSCRPKINTSSRGEAQMQLKKLNGLVCGALLCGALLAAPAASSAQDSSSYTTSTPVTCKDGT